MRRAMAIARRPTLWLGLALFLASIWVLQTRVSPPPQFVVRTDAVYGWENGPIRPTGTWASVRHVSDDGTEVILGVHHGDVRYVGTRLQLWDVRTGENRTPPMWRDEDWSELLSRSGLRGDRNHLLGLLAQSGGRRLLADESVWASLRRRWSGPRSKEEPTIDWRHLIPGSASFSPDGSRLACATELRFAIRGIPVTFGRCTVVEDVATGRCVALLPGVRYGVGMAPGGRVAVAGHVPEDRKAEQPRLDLWDLDAGTRRAELRLLDEHSRVEFSPDGRFVFAWCMPWHKPFLPCLQWWDAATGDSVRTVVNAPEWTLLDGGRVVVTHPWRDIPNGGARETYRLNFWDAATGTHLGEWDLGARSDGGGMIDDLIGCTSGRYLAATYSPDTGVGRSPTGRIGDRLARAVGDVEPGDRKEIILWDVVERSEVARLPGREAALSDNGRWLASVDGRGTLRVWEVPVRRPWGWIVGYAAVSSVVGLAALVLLARVARKLGGRNSVRWLGRVAAGVWRDRARRRWAAAALGGLGLVLGVIVWDSVAASAARTRMEAAYDQIGHETTEADVVALVGRPPDDGPVTPISGPLRGGGVSGIPVTTRKWTWHGTEMTVDFGEDGTAKASYISDPRGSGLLESVVNWLGW